MLNPIVPTIDHIVQAFYPKPLECCLNGKTYFIERIADGWAWRNEDGDTQDDYGLEAFEEAWQCQRSAIGFVRATRKAAV